MINVYKIGLKWYDEVDKNGGLFEYRIIEEELSNIITDQRVLVIINGKFFEDEETSLLELIKCYNTTIFIATDIIAFENNSKIIEASDYLLHQSPLVLQQFYYKPQLYSYVPELFYRYVTADTSVKNNKMIFGGGVRDNEDLILEYLQAVPSTAYLKTAEKDNRISYNEYLKELAKHKYSLVISRKAYQKIGWVTPRYVEALALNTLPICDYNYDKFSHFFHINIGDSSSLEKIIQDYEEYPCFYSKTLQQSKDAVSKDVDNFKIIIAKLTGGNLCS